MIPRDYKIERTPFPVYFNKAWRAGYQAIHVPSGRTVGSHIYGRRRDALAAIVLCERHNDKGDQQ